MLRELERQCIKQELINCRKTLLRLVLHALQQVQSLMPYFSGSQPVGNYSQRGNLTCFGVYYRSGAANSGSRPRFRSWDLPLWLAKYFKFAIRIGQNKSNHLLFYVPSFIQFCARKSLLSILVL